MFLIKQHYGINPNLYLFNLSVYVYNTIYLFLLRNSFVCNLPLKYKILLPAF